MATNPPSSAAAADSNANCSFSSGVAGGTVQGCSCKGNEHGKICAAICSCSTQWCVSKALWELDRLCNNKSTIKAEVPYDMSTSPPQPYMSNNDPDRSTRRRPADSRIPDVVITKDGSKPPTQDNIAEVVEIKYPGDAWRPGQLEAYQEIAGTANVTEMSPQKCGCKKPDSEPVDVAVPAEQKQENQQSSGVSGWAIAGGILAGVALVAAIILVPEVTIPALAAASEGGEALTVAEGATTLGGEALTTSQGMSTLAAANDNQVVAQTLSSAFK